MATPLNGFNVQSAEFAVAPEDCRLLFDVTGMDSNGARVTDHEIMDTLLALIDRAGDTIVLDMFLVNKYMGELGSRGDMRDTTGELVDALVRKKRHSPNTFILFITDPINSSYAERCPAALQPLTDAGGSVVLTDLAQLPDSNHLYSPFYRALRPLGKRLPPLQTRVFPNPFHQGGPRVSLGQFLRLLNFKANHRKTAVIRDRDGQWRALITSANPHTASSAHGNVGAVLKAGPVMDILIGEYRVAHSSILGDPKCCFGSLTAPELVRVLEKRLAEIPASAPRPIEGDSVRVSYMTEDRIGDALNRMLKDSGEGDTIQMMMFYLSDPAVVQHLKGAAKRGARIRLLLDPNRDAFGHEKHGIPNRVIGTQLHRWASKTSDIDVELRWFDTHGEQAHFKLLRIVNWASGRDSIVLGSANFTTRNLRGYNLESALRIEDAGDLGRHVGEVFTKLWQNREGLTYTVPAQDYTLNGLQFLRGRMRAAFGNTTGMCTY
ncbi:MAG: hypothetical protein K9N51_06810 [Candidatus Pacebacteria bacterium]|nr:hypothetical protein [Candidatus Paceibacterota bacterium]